MGFSRLWELLMDRAAWPAVIHGVAKSQTRPEQRNWTELICVSFCVCLILNTCITIIWQSLQRSTCLTQFSIFLMIRFSGKASWFTTSVSWRECLPRPPTQCNSIACPEMPSHANVCLSALKHFCVSSPQCSFWSCLRKCSGNYWREE